MENLNESRSIAIVTFYKITKHDRNTKPSVQTFIKKIPMNLWDILKKDYIVQDIKNIPFMEQSGLSLATFMEYKEVLETLKQKNQDVLEFYIINEHIYDNISLFQTQQLEDMLASKNQAYHERNLLVCALSKIFPSHITVHTKEEIESGIIEKAWRYIICIHLPTGQATWHIHENELSFFSHLSKAPSHFDGHTTDEKYARLESLPINDLTYDQLTQVAIRQASNGLIVSPNIADIRSIQRTDMAQEVINNQSYPSPATVIYGSIESGVQGGSSQQGSSSKYVNPYDDPSVGRAWVRGQKINNPNIDTEDL